jgi:hypothetical protein
MRSSRCTLPWLVIGRAHAYCRSAVRCPASISFRVTMSPCAYIGEVSGLRQLLMQAVCCSCIAVPMRLDLPPTEYSNRNVINALVGNIQYKRCPMRNPIRVKTVSFGYCGVCSCNVRDTLFSLSSK